LPLVPSLKSCSPPVTAPPAVRVATPANENNLEFASIPLAENVKFPDRVAVVPEVMLTGADAVIVGVVVEAAVMVTLTAAAGAVYVVEAALAVCVGLKLPHVPTGVQLQSTPALAVSLATVAATEAVAFTAKEVGGAVLSVTVMAVAAVTVTAAEAVVELLEVAAATMVTLPAADGAVYVVAAPLAVCAGLKVPQAPAGEQLQSTPPFAESFVTVAAMETVPLTAKVAGGAVLKVIARAGGGGVTV
jgi:hypothetical protein